MISNVIITALEYNDCKYIIGASIKNVTVALNSQILSIAYINSETMNLPKGETRFIVN